MPKPEIRVMFQLLVATGIKEGTLLCGKEPRLSDVCSAHYNSIAECLWSAVLSSRASRFLPFAPFWAMLVVAPCKSQEAS